MAPNHFLQLLNLYLRTGVSHRQDRGGRGKRGSVQRGSLDQTITSILNNKELKKNIV